MQDRPRTIVEGVAIWPQSESETNVGTRSGSLRGGILGRNCPVYLAVSVSR